MQIDREIWLKVQPHFSTALSLDAHTRTTWLSELDAREPSLAPLLRRLIDNHEKAIGRAELETIPKLAPPPPASPFSAGQVIGPFRLISVLGRGGMGEVWRAAQLGGHIEREIALKLPINIDHSTVAARFLRERSMLAELSHPNIARLIDAGVSRIDGGREQPWMAIDLVTGEPLHQYLSRHTTDCEMRIRLFRQILAAVAHAHRHLIVHRDLKPANILVDAEGAVKLLDFGIAKLIDETTPADQTEFTQIGGRALTLRYAAPEQITGAAISTATDIYALGVILFEMLTGASPYRAVREARPLTELAVTTEDVARPSQVRDDPALRGDLDAIVLKALRCDPAARYATVEAFATDLQAFLDQRPVSAREGTRRYLLGRFAARHKWPIAAACAVLVALAAGLGVAETQRRQAVAEQTRAERHFASVRSLSNRLLFDVHAEIESLPGALKAREKLVSIALSYLDRLAGEVRDDAELDRELAQAYGKIAYIQGGGSNNLGKLEDAIASFEKALQLFDRVPPGGREALEDDRSRRDLLAQLSRIYLGRGDAKWRDALLRSNDVAARIAANPEATLIDRYLVPNRRAYFEYLSALNGSASPEGIARAKAAAGELLALVARHPEEKALVSTAASTLSYVGQVLSSGNAPREDLLAAIGYFGQAQDLLNRPGAESAPTKSDTMDRIGFFQHMAGLQMKTGQLDAAQGSVREGLALVAAMIARDAHDTAAPIQRLRLATNAVEIHLARGQFAQALAAADRALADYASLPPQIRGALMHRSIEAELHMAAANAIFAIEGKAKGPPDKACVHTRALSGFVTELLDKKMVDAANRSVVEYMRLARACGLATPSPAAQ